MPCPDGSLETGRGPWKGINHITGPAVHSLHNELQQATCVDVSPQTGTITMYWLIIGAQFWWQQVYFDRMWQMRESLKTPWRMFSCLENLPSGHSYRWAGVEHPQRAAEMPAKGATGREEILQLTVKPLGPWCLVHDLRYTIYGCIHVTKSNHRRATHALIQVWGEIHPRRP